MEKIEHTTVATNGINMHIASIGTGPVILFPSRLPWPLVLMAQPASLPLLPWLPLHSPWPPWIWRHRRPALLRHLLRDPHRRWPCWPSWPSGYRPGLLGRPWLGSYDGPVLLLVQARSCQGFGHLERTIFSQEPNYQVCGWLESFIRWWLLFLLVSGIFFNWWNLIIYLTPVT